MNQATSMSRSAVAKKHAAKQARPAKVAFYKEFAGTIGMIASFIVLFIVLVAMFSPKGSTMVSSADAAEPTEKSEVRFDRAAHLKELEAQYLGE